MARMVGWGVIIASWDLCAHTVPRTAEQSQGGKVVGVDPTLITTCE